MNLEKMVHTLPEEIREISDIMVSEIMDKIIDCQDQDSHLPLYELHSQLDGGESYFRTVCREFWREYGSKLSSDYQQLKLSF